MAQTVKRLPAMWETWIQSLGLEDPLEKEMATHSSTFAWKIPWMEESGGLQSMGSQRVGHDWATSFHLKSYIDKDYKNRYEPELYADKEETWRRMDIWNLSIMKKRIRKRNGGTEDNLIIYHLNQETFRCSTGTSDKTEDIFCLQQTSIYIVTLTTTTKKNPQDNSPAFFRNRLFLVGARNLSNKTNYVKLRKTDSHFWTEVENGQIIYKVKLMVRNRFESCQHEEWICSTKEIIPLTEIPSLLIIYVCKLFPSLQSMILKGRARSWFLFVNHQA